MSDLQVYYYPGCPFAQRTRMVLIEKDLSFEQTEVISSRDGEWFRKISPYGKVPCLKHGENVLYESAVINEYLEEVFPEPALLPSDPYLRAQARIWMHYCDNYYAQATRGVSGNHSNPEAREENIPKLMDVFRFMETEGLAKLSDGPFWFGESVSLVDLHYSPFLERFSAYEPLWGVRIPDDCSRLLAWVAALKGLKSYQETARSMDDHVIGLQEFLGFTA